MTFRDDEAATLELDFPILEFDHATEAIIEPSRVIRPIDGIAERCVLCFFQEVFDRLKQRGETRQIGSLRSEIGEHPVYEMDIDGRRLTLFHPGVGDRWRRPCWTGRLHHKSRPEQHFLEIAIVPGGSEPLVFHPDLRGFLVLQ